MLARISLMALFSMIPLNAADFDLLTLVNESDRVFLFQPGIEGARNWSPEYISLQSGETLGFRMQLYVQRDNRRPLVCLQVYRAVSGEELYQPHNMIMTQHYSLHDSVVIPEGLAPAIAVPTRRAILTDGVPLLGQMRRSDDAAAAGPISPEDTLRSHGFITGTPGVEDQLLYGDKLRVRGYIASGSCCGGEFLVPRPKDTGCCTCCCCSCCGRTPSFRIQAAPVDVCMRTSNCSCWFIPCSAMEYGEHMNGTRVVIRESESCCCDGCHRYNGLQFSSENQVASCAGAISEALLKGSGYFCCVCCTVATAFACIPGMPVIPSW